MISAGFSPDLNVVRHHTFEVAPGVVIRNHECWQWQHAAVTQYVDTSDLHSLIAPRGLVVQTGIADPSFSSFKPPFVSDKQVARRSRVAYDGRGERFLHYLQPHRHGELTHQFRVGDRHSRSPENPPVGVQITQLTHPGRGAAGAQTWQIDAGTTTPDLDSPEPTQSLRLY